MTTPEAEALNLDEWGTLLFKATNGGLYSGTYAVYDTDETTRVEDVTRERIARVDRWHIENGDYAEESVVLLVELTDGTWAACMAWCDTTGWDCQAGVQWKWAPTREEVVRQGLDRSSRAAIGEPLDGESPVPGGQ